MFMFFIKRSSTKNSIYSGSQLFSFNGFNLVFFTKLKTFYGIGLRNQTLKSLASTALKNFFMSQKNCHNFVFRKPF